MKADCFSFDYNSCGSKKSPFKISSYKNGIRTPSGSLREIRIIEDNATILVVTGQVYDESNRIRTWDEYLKWFTECGELQ